MRQQSGSSKWMGDKMNAELSVKTAVCTLYEKLLEDCQSACQIWNKQRAEIRECGWHGKKMDDELRRLQARYARAYSVLRNHVHDCETCQWVSKLEERSSARSPEQSNFFHVAL
jgi:mannose/cellobiose epimerase-like protein (N-acyl-D-glucosamine 2-epimerase family)